MKMSKIVIRYVPLFLVGWWLSAMFITKVIGMADGWVTLAGLGLIWVFGRADETE